MDKLDGKVAIVTGAARGLGRAYAKRLAGLGAKVAVADLCTPMRNSRSKPKT
jgi:3-oxoacyl-[acyl-carrier protein] reductase